MQQAPYRLSQTIWTAFRASKPIPRPRVPIFSSRPRQAQSWLRREPAFAIQTRFYSENSRDVDKKAEDAKRRIEDTLESRVEAVAAPDTKLRDSREETIVHTNPESSSIVYTHASSQDGTSSSPPKSSSRPLPPEKPSHTSPVRQRFSSFMDNFQSHLFTASQRLNDLTGYSGIEALKNEIARQESLVMSERQNVKNARTDYASAVATRSTTQREVNDLLHRKHAWTSADLERFTSLYRSDHANEQTETAAQKEVSDAETRYEEASTKLARTILARYHEEQIWSDKIRQMSTWGTWGLMGLNVLLFVVFQIMIEPWRRRRLVKGFEEKVEMALKERDEETRTMALSGGLVKSNDAPAPPVSAAEAGSKLDNMADHITEQIVDAVSGGSPSSKEEIEASSETQTGKELASEEAPTGLNAVAATVTKEYSAFENALRGMFSDRRLIVTQREMTTAGFEAAAIGAVFTALLMVLLRPK